MASPCGRVSSAGRQPVTLTPSAPRGRGPHVPGRPRGAEAAVSPRRERPSRWRRVLPLAAVLAALLPAVAGCTSNEFTRLAMPVPATSQGQVTLTLWQGSWVAAFAVGLVVWGMIIWAIIFHRKNRAGASQEPPAQVRYNLPIEMLYTVVPFIMVGVLFFFTARDENYIDRLPPHPDVIVNVVGYQWSWQFQYPQYQVPGSVTRDVTMNGGPWQPGLGTRGLPELVIPTNETVRIGVTWKWFG